jgi:diguanylate cyclase (GGDEF)-like protein/PAS domain S-box-containing protein
MLRRRSLFAGLMPRSIVARTSLSILFLAVSMGLLFSMMASWRVRAAEHDRLLARVDQLMSTVESTASIASYLNDATLAKEIANGLMKNRVVAGVRIMSGPAPLYATALRSSETGAGEPMEILERTIYSPFDAGAAVGQLTLFVSHAEVDAQAAAYSRYTTWILGLQMSIVAAAVAYLVYLLVTRPIKGISDELHRLEIRSGMRLTFRSTRRKDEIGQLVMDVNGLIARLTSALDTERELRVEREISEKRMRLVFEKADTGMLVIDRQGVVQSCNPAFVRILGPAASAPDAQLKALLAPHGATVAALIEESQALGEPRDADLELDIKGPRGKVWVEFSVNPIGPNLVQALVNDITERKNAEVLAQELASRDTLTGLLNRRGFDAALNSLLSRSRREGHLALLQIDLDHFKSVNDNHGHEAGDLVLTEVARIFERCVRRSDIVGRMGGDEFAVLLPGVESLAHAEEIARSIVVGVEVPIDIGGQWACIGASIGIALLDDAGESSAEFLRRADLAMYAAKQAGRGRATVAANTVGDSGETAAA